ncbi:MAG TPA: M4 family metallopeptidase [Waterburya sp.]|jgi:hypothetical protein
MAKVALLIGVSEYQAGLNPLPAAAKDVEAMQRVLEKSEIGGFTEVKPLLNPDPLVMQEAIETLFSGRQKDDLVLLFFSGHGVKDDSGRLYFSTRITRKNTKGELVKATAVPASFVQDIMSHSRCKRQVVILDCCFSGAFAEGLLAKDDGSIDVQTQLGGEGRVVLTSSTSTQYSYEQQNSELSVYTRYLVEGIETGVADLDNDGAVSVDELHEYAKSKVQETAPAMKPKIYAVEEGYKIRLAQAPIGDPKLRYRKEVERYKSRGEIPYVGRSVLDALRDSLQLLPEDATAIEVEVLKPYQDYKEKLQRYEQVFSETIQRENPLSENTRDDLKRLQQVLGLRNEDVAPIEERIARPTPVPSPKSSLLKKPRLLIGTAIAAAVVSLIAGYAGYAGYTYIQSESYQKARTASKEERYEECVNLTQTISKIFSFYSDAQNLLHECRTKLASSEVAFKKIHEDATYAVNFLNELFKLNVEVPPIKPLKKTIVNAYWNGEQYNAPPQVQYLPDVTYHEIAHIFLAKKVNFQFQGQSGSLVESYADIFASLIKQKRLGQTAKTADWTVVPGAIAWLKGEDIPNSKDKSPLRSLKAPETAYSDPISGKDPQPSHISKLYTGEKDFGGVHINSGIPNKAFYETAIRIGSDKAGKIWCEALSQLTPTSNFQQAAAATYQVAGKLYGNNSNEQKAVKSAWEIVGISSDKKI